MKRITQHLTRFQTAIIMTVVLTATAISTMGLKYHCHYNCIDLDTLRSSCNRVSFWACGGNCTLTSYSPACGQCLQEVTSYYGGACVEDPFVSKQTVQTGACSFYFIKKVPIWCTCPSSYPVGTEKEADCQCNTTTNCMS